MTYLILVRHGESEWNEKGLWTGWQDVPLTQKGIEEAKNVGTLLREIPLHKAHTSILTRAKETLRHIKETLNLKNLVTKTHPALNERHYGIHTGKNKWQVRDEVGEEEFQRIRRSWDHNVEEGETLKDVYHRVIPYFENHIQQDLKNGNNTLVVAHNNSLRALAKYLENISNEEITNFELGHNEAHCYLLTNHTPYRTKKSCVLQNKKIVITKKSPRKDIIVKTNIQNQELTLHSTWGLFSPTKLDEGTELLLKNIKVTATDTSLDIGCGYGAIGLTVAKLSPQGVVHLVDKDFVAVEFAKKNAKINEVSNCEIYLSNGLSNVPRELQCDHIFSNLPANIGKELFSIIFEDVYSRLKPGGRFSVVTISGIREFIKRSFKEIFGNYDKLDTSKTYTAAQAVKI